MPKNMWTRIFIFCGLGLLVSLFPPPAGAQPPTGGCTPDSLLFSGNLRFHYPGEPLQWVDSALLDSLIALQLDAFNLIVESPRNPNRQATICYSRSPGGREVLYVSADLRFITYDMQSRKNASQSTLLGHTHFAHPYWFEEQLHFQNGWSNWNKHTDRIYHSASTGEMEYRQMASPPDGTEIAKVFTSDSTSYFILLRGPLEDASEPIDIYTLPHGGTEWVREGVLNPSITRWKPGERAYELEHYVAFMNSGDLLVVRRSDLAFCIVGSTAAAKQARDWQEFKKLRSNSWRGTSGDRLMFTSRFGSYEEDIAELVEGAEWEPFIVPAPLKNVPFYAQGNPQYWGWSVAIALGCITLFLSFTLLWTGRVQRKRQTPIVLPDGTEQAPLSPMVITLLTHRGKQLGAEQFDAVIGLSGVHSPETRRSRRARIIQVANAEATARFGQPLIEREKSASDKRVVLYKIRDVSDPT